VGGGPVWLRHDVTERETPLPTLTRDSQRSITSAETPACIARYCSLVLIEIGMSRKLETPQSQIS
jgi:hypothetical protein